MKRIYYAGASLLTGERIAESVLRYAAALAKVGSADEPSHSDLEDPSFVAELDRKTRALGISQAQPVEQESDENDYDML